MSHVFARVRHEVFDEPEDFSGEGGEGGHSDKFLGFLQMTKVLILCR